MRTLMMIAALAVSAAVPADTDACGVYGPRGFMLAHSGGRAFALLSHADASTATWTRLNGSTSFDDTKIAPAPQREHAMTLTLVGPGGTKVVETRTAWLIDPMLGGRGPRHALEVPAGRREFVVALSGKQDARWIALGHREATAADRAWLAEQKIERGSMYVTTLGRTGYELVEAGGTERVRVFVRKGGTLVQEVTGSVIGGVVWHGQTFLVTASSNTAQFVPLY